MKTFARILVGLVVAVLLGAHGVTALGGAVTFYRNNGVSSCGAWGSSDWVAVYARNPSTGVTGSLLWWSVTKPTDGLAYSVTYTPGLLSYSIVSAAGGLGHPWDGSNVTAYDCPLIPYVNRVVVGAPMTNYTKWTGTGGYTNNTLEIRQLQLQRRRVGGGQWEDVGDVFTLQPGQSTSHNLTDSEEFEWQYIARSPILTDDGFQHNQVVGSGGSGSEDVPSPVTPGSSQGATSSGDPFTGTRPPVTNPVNVTNQPRQSIVTATNVSAATDYNADARARELRDLLAGQYLEQRAADAARAIGDANNTARLEAAINRTTDAVNSGASAMTNAVGDLKNELGEGMGEGLGTGTNFSTGNLPSIAGNLAAGMGVGVTVPAAVAPVISLPFSSVDSRLENPTIDFSHADLAPYVAGVRAFLLLLVLIAGAFAAWRIIGRLGGT